MLNRVWNLVNRVTASPEWKWLVLLLIVLAILRVYTHFRKRRKRSQRKPSPLIFDLTTIELKDAPPERVGLRLYHMPVRIGLVVVAPLGRDTPPIPGDFIPDLLNCALPGLGRMMARDGGQLRLWPVQLSEQGFVHALSRYVPLPGNRGKGTPWSLIAGKVVCDAGQYMLGLALRGIEPNNVGVIIVESEHQWLDVLRIADESPS